MPYREVFSHFGATCLPTWGKHVTQHGQARCPTWAHFVVSFLPNIFNFEKEQYGGENRWSCIMMQPDFDEIRLLFWRRVFLR